MHRSAYRAALGSLLFVLAACEDYGRVTGTVVDPSYSPQELSYAGDPRKGGLLTIVHGNPTDGPREDLVALVYDTLARAAPARNVKPTGERQPGERGIYSVVMVFDPASQVVDADLCAGRIPPSRTPGREITVRAAFCRGSAPLTGAIGEMESALAREEPERFDRFLRDVGTTLFPSRSGG
jgi:hypothetical protein